MPEFEFLARVEGLICATDEEEARLCIRVTLGRLGSVDIEELNKIDDDDEEDGTDREQDSG